jgi:hypothetical protein
MLYYSSLIDYECNYAVTPIYCKLTWARNNS